MFKLPLLQPHLTGSGGVEGRTGSISKYSPFLARSGRDGMDGLASAPSSGSGGLGGTAGGPGAPALGGPTMEVKDWESQARDITADVTSSDKYKSIALHAEVKLAEALERCTRVCPTAYTPEGDEKPNKLKTAVCCQLLGEFADLCGPFAGVLRSIKTELIRAIYSPLYVSERGLLVFDQLPWFSVAERLERDKEVMAEERRRFEELLQEQQAMIARIEEQVASYQRGLSTAQLEAATAKSRLESLVVSEESARLEAKTGREELKRLRKEWLRMRDDLDAEIKAHGDTKGGLEAEVAGLRERVRVMSGQLVQVVGEAEEARRAASVSLAPEVAQGLREEVAGMEAALVAARKQVQELSSGLEEAREQLGSMTPRPSCRELRPFGIFPERPTHNGDDAMPQPSHGRTQALVAAAAAKLAALVASQEAAVRAAQLLEAVAQPEPAPAEVTLAVTTDASAYFITEGQSDGERERAAPSTVAIEGLGTGPNVPRCLRWPSGEMIAGISVLDPGDAAALAWEVLRAKQAHDASHPPEHLQAFLYQWCAERARPEVAAATAAAARSAGGAGAPARPGALRATPPSQNARHVAPPRRASNLNSSGGGLTKSISLSRSAGGALAAEAHMATGPEPEALHAAVVRHAYTVCHAAASNARASPVLRMFWAVLTGQLAEAAVSDVQLQLAALLQAAAAQSQPATAGPSEGSQGASPREQYGQEEEEASVSQRLVPTAAVHEALTRMYPSRPSYKLTRLKDTYASSVAPDAVQLSVLDGLLRPVAWGCDAAAVAAAAHARPEGTPGAGGGGTQGGSSGGGTGAAEGAGGSPHASASAQGGTSRSARSQALVDSLSHPFVSMLIQQHLEDVQQAATEVLAAVEQLPPAGQAPPGVGAGSAQPAGSSGGGDSPGASSAQLGGLVSAASVLQALVASGISVHRAARAVACVVGGGAGAGGVLSTDLAAVVAQSSIRVWCGLASAKLACEVLLKPQALHDVPGLVAWANTAQAAA